MLSIATFGQILLYSLLSVPISQATPQNSGRIHLTQEELCCFDIRFVKPVYPEAARLAHIEGVAKLILVIGTDNSIADLQPVSGNPLLLDSAMRAVRQWRFITMFGGRVAGTPSQEIEVPLAFTFQIEQPPKPAYLYLASGKVIRADEVREYTDRIEYTANGHIRHLSPAAVTDIKACPSPIYLPRNPHEASCIPGGGPPIFIRAIPLLLHRGAVPSSN
jgi:hypothetical protein